MTDRPLIAIVEDDVDVAASIRALLDVHGYQTEHFESGEAFLAAERAPSACVLMDVRMPGVSGLETLSAHVRRGAATPVIVMTGHGDIAMAVDALKRGAFDFIEKPFDDADFLRRIEAARYAARSTEKQAAIAENFARLTKRETEVMREVVEGAANKVIAHRLGLSPKTVEIHRSRVMEKTGATSLSHLVRMATKVGIEPDEDAPSE